MGKSVYVPLGVHVLDDHRVLDAGPDAELHYYRILQVAKRTERDGILTRRQIDRLHPKAKTTLPTLLEVGLLREIDGGYRPAGWHDWNITQEAVDGVRDRERQRVAAWRAAKRSGVRTDDTTNAICTNGVRTENEHPVRTAYTRDRDRDRDREETEKREVANKSVGTSSVLPHQGSAPSARRTGEAQPLLASLHQLGLGGAS